MTTILRIQLLGLLAQLLVMVTTPAARQVLSRLWSQAEVCQDAGELGRMIEFAREAHKVLVDPAAQAAAIAEVTEVDHA